MHNPNRYFDVFVVEVKFMFGDADGYKTVDVPFPQEHEQTVVDFLNFLAQCAVRYPHGKGGCDDYSDVPGYVRWVLEARDADYEDDHEDDRGELGLDYWPSVEGECPASYNSAIVVYYDAAGCKHPVEITIN